MRKPEKRKMSPKYRHTRLPIACSNPKSRWEVVVDPFCDVLSETGGTFLEETLKGEPWRDEVSGSGLFPRTVSNRVNRQLPSLS